MRFSTIKNSASFVTIVNELIKECKIKVLESYFDDYAVIEQPKQSDEQELIIKDLQCSIFVTGDDEFNDIGPVNLYTSNSESNSKVLTAYSGLKEDCCILSITLDKKYVYGVNKIDGCSWQLLAKNGGRKFAYRVGKLQTNYFLLFFFKSSRQQRLMMQNSNQL